MMIRALIATLALAAGAATAAEVKLGWEFKATPETSVWGGSCVGVQNYHSDCGRDVMAAMAGSVKFLSATLDRNNLVLDLLAHNPSADWYQCLYLTSGENIVHMDDELANEYRGAMISYANGLDNKFALNQRKRIQVRLPRPSDDVDLVNLHFGFSFMPISSEKPCKDPIVNFRLNFHQVNWDVTPLRAE